MSDEHACTWIVLCGAHGSGKSTLGKELAARWDAHAVFDAELGDEARERELERDAGAFGFCEQPEFEWRLFEQEAERDEARRGERRRVIETWHIGNLGYAICRSPGASEALEAAAEAHIARLDARVRIFIVPLACDSEASLERLTQKGAGEAAAERALLAAWFAGVGDEAALVAGRLAARLRGWWPRRPAATAARAPSRASSRCAGAGGGPGPAAFRFWIPTPAARRPFASSSRGRRAGPGARCLCLVVWVSSPALDEWELDAALAPPATASPPPCGSPSAHAAPCTVRAAPGRRGASGRPTPPTGAGRRSAVRAEAIEREAAPAALGFVAAAAPTRAPPSRPPRAASRAGRRAAGEAALERGVAAALAGSPQGRASSPGPPSTSPGRARRARRPPLDRPRSLRRPASASLARAGGAAGRRGGAGGLRRRLRRAPRLRRDPPPRPRGARPAPPPPSRPARRQPRPSAPAAALVGRARGAGFPHGGGGRLGGRPAASLGALLPRPPPLLGPGRAGRERQVDAGGRLAERAPAALLATPPRPSPPSAPPAPPRPVPPPRPASQAQVRPLLDGADRTARRAFYSLGNYAAGRAARAVQAEGRACVMDRYWPSTAAYGAAEAELRAGPVRPAPERAGPRQSAAAGAGGGATPRRPASPSAPPAPKPPRPGEALAEAPPRPRPAQEEAAFRAAVAAAYLRVEGAAPLRLPPRAGPEAAAQAALELLRPAAPAPLR
eukprot:tig00001258_g7826.t1